MLAKIGVEVAAMRILFLALCVAFLAFGEEPMALGGGGFMAGLLFLDLSELNTYLVQNGFAGLPSPLVLSGGGGMGGLLEGSRVGGAGFGGETQSVLNEKRASLSLGAGGFLTEQALFSKKTLAFALGFMIGGGDAELLLVFRKPSSFEDALTSPVCTRLRRGFFLLVPYLSAEVFLLDWAFLKVNVGFFFTLGGPWEADGVSVSGPPASFHAPLLQLFFHLGGVLPLEEEGG
jgi:hypothetical protein